MKATIITLAALASTAFAGTLTISGDDFTVTNGTAKYELGDNALSYTEDWSLTVTFTGSSTSWPSSWGTAVLATGSTPTGANFGNGFQIYAQSSTNGSSIVVMLNVTSDSEKTSTGLSSDGTHTLTVTYTAGTNTISLYSVTDESSTLLGSSTITDTSVTISSLSSNAIGVEGWEISSIVITADSVTSNAVPEPATATLSLLALAGLAARRRRK